LFSFMRFPAIRVPPVLRRLAFATITVPMILAMGNRL
jgi:hypothetical protein